MKASRLPARQWPPRIVHRGLAVLLALAWLAARVSVVRAEPAAEVRVESVRPRKVKHPTLRFLKANRDFLRGQMDRLREQPVAQRGDADAVDPRLLAYGELLARVQAARDSVHASEDAQARRELLTSVTQLGDLESQLDQLERLLGEQRVRLATLERNFAGDQKTALMVVVSGYPAGVELSAVAVTLEDGTVMDVPLSPEQCVALRQGGVVQVFHGLVEPREQVFEVALRGTGWIANGPGYVTLDPARDRLTVLRLELSTAAPAVGAAGIHATTWLHDARVSSIDG